MTLQHREEQLAELMDDPACDPATLRRTLRRFWIVNRAVSRWGLVYRTHLRPALAAAPGPARILDIGCGGGDVLRRLLRLARRDGFTVEGVGIDPDPRAIDVAQARGADSEGVRFRQSDSRALAAADERFELVISNHLLHHLDSAQLTGVLADSESLATRLCVHSDIARDPRAYAAFSVASAAVAPGTFLRVDGLRSIRRSYTRDELAARLPDGWRAEQPAAFRVLATHRARSRR
ncbi:methyltransferase domain-containing protein [Leucobacter sp. VD1]|uniref:methyltransferase domain-containing protein n=1 Tax=Leucobacter sp. VD1 TaxID=3080381 RepID=UPI003016DD93